MQRPDGSLKGLIIGNLKKNEVETSIGNLRNKAETGIGYFFRNEIKNSNDNRKNAMKTSTDGLRDEWAWGREEYILCITLSDDATK